MSHYLKRLQTETVHDNKWWKYQKDLVERPDGTSKEYFYAEGLGAVVVIPVLPDGKLVLVHKYRYLGGRTSLEFPMGKIIAGETPLQAAIKALGEEAGYTSGEFINIGAFEPFNSFFKFSFQIFLARKVVESHELALSMEEENEVFVRRADELEMLVKRGEVWDGKTLAAWAIARDRLVQ